MRVTKTKNGIKITGEHPVLALFALLFGVALVIDVLVLLIFIS